MSSESDAEPTTTLSEKLRALGAIVGGLGTLPAFSFGMLAVFIPFDWVTLGIAFALIAFCVGALTAPARIEKHRGVVRISTLVLVLLIGGHLLVAGEGERLRMVSLPSGEQSSILSRFVIERDVSELGASVTLALGVIDFNEGWRLPEAMNDAYDRMAEAEGAVPTPLIRTFFGEHTLDDFDTVIIDPNAWEAEVGVVFLHGSGGNFVLNCWQVSQAADAVKAVTACPSMDSVADWAGSEGVAKIKITIEHLRGLGAKRIYLAGLSAGGMGASKAAASLGDAIDGLILISGAAEGARPPNKPVLVVHGEQDTMARAKPAWEFVQAAGPLGQYEGLEGGHFVFLEQHDTARELIAGWLRGQEIRARRSRDNPLQ